MTATDTGPAPRLLDLRGLKCPLPVLRTRKALERLTGGSLLRVECTDPLSAIDIPHMLNGTADRLEAHLREGPVHVFLIRRGG